jgi:death-on-curing protein
MAEITWITQELACAIHDRQLDIHGGMAGIRDEGLLSSALARARNLFAYSNPKPDLAQLAAAYAYGLVKNHAFVDGNKRTAHVVYRTFLTLNNTVLSVSLTEKFEVMVQLADGTIDEEQFADWIRKNIQPNE